MTSAPKSKLLHPWIELPEPFKSWGFYPVGSGGGWWQCRQRWHEDHSDITLRGSVRKQQFRMGVTIYGSWRGNRPRVIMRTPVLGPKKLAALFTVYILTGQLGDAGDNQ